MVKVTKDDYFKFSGINLEIELLKVGNDNVSRYPDIYIKNITDWVYEYMNDNFVAPKYPLDDTDAIIKKAILYQIQWWLLHGNLSLRNPDDLAVLSPNAYRVLKNGGLANGWSW